MQPRLRSCRRPHSTQTRVSLQRSLGGRPRYLPVQTQDEAQISRSDAVLIRTSVACRGPAEEKQQRGQSTEIGCTAVEATVF
jgi:hypothetical protein